MTHALAEECAVGNERRNRALRRARQQAAVERAPLRGLHLWTLTGRLFLLAGARERLQDLVRQLRKEGMARAACAVPEALGPAGLPAGFGHAPLKVAEVERLARMRFRWFRALDLGPGDPSLTLAGETVVARIPAEELPHVLAALEDGSFPSFSFQSLVYTGGQTLALAGDWLGIE